MSALTPRRAFGAPGIEPRWSRSDKLAVGTAYFTGSRVWFTLAAGIVSEVYYPTIDRPQIRDLQYLITDGETFFHDERRDLDCQIEQLSDHSLGFRMTNTNEQYDYRIIKEVVTDPHYSCLLMHTRLEGDESLLERLQLYALLAPHLNVGGSGNNGYLETVGGRDLLMAQKDGVWLAMAASIPFLRRSCGYVGASDGWTDLADNYRMDWEFDVADNGNVALMGQVDLRKSFEFTLGMAFGHSAHDAQTTLLQSIATPFSVHRERFVEQWQRTCGHVAPLKGLAGDDGALYRRSHSLLLAHEDKSFPGALIASLSIPWGESKGDDDLGGYHLVWPRDMVHSATALLATGNTATPYRSLVYLACTQNPDGGFHQNFWINGDSYWSGVQLDEVSFAILLAWRVKQAKALRDFDPYPMVLLAAGYLVRQGPATPQERWEENSGYSPSSLAANIAALACAAMMAEERGDAHVAAYLREYADFLEAHVDRLDRDHREHACARLPPALRPHSAGRHWQCRTRRGSESGDRADQEPGPGIAVPVPGQGHRRCRLSGTGALRHSQGRRSAAGGLAARWSMRCSNSTRRSAPAGGGTIMTVMASTTTAGRLTVGDADAVGRCSPASEGTTSWPPAAT